MVFVPCRLGKSELSSLRGDYSLLHLFPATIPAVINATAVGWYCWRVCYSQNGPLFFTSCLGL